MQFADYTWPDRPARMRLIKAFVAAYRTSGYISIMWRTENVQTKLHRCARWGLSLFAYGIKDFFASLSRFASISIQFSIKIRKRVVYRRVCMPQQTVPRRAHNLETTTLNQRWIDVLSTLCARWDVSVPHMYIFISLFLYVYTFHYRNSLCNAYTPCYSIIYCENMACRGGVVFQDPFYTTFHLCFILFTCSNISLHKHHLIRFTNKRFSMSHVRKKEKKKVLFFSGILLDLC